MAKSMSKEEITLNQQVEDLQMRMQILSKFLINSYFPCVIHIITVINFPCVIENDRKANMEVLEANKAANKEEIKRLRDEGKEFRQKLAVLMKVAVLIFNFFIIIRIDLIAILILKDGFD